MEFFKHVAPKKLPSREGYRQNAGQASTIKMNRGSVLWLYIQSSVLILAPVIQ